VPTPWTGRQGVHAARRRQSFSGNHKRAPASAPVPVLGFDGEHVDDVLPGPPAWGPPSESLPSGFPRRRMPLSPVPGAIATPAISSRAAGKRLPTTMPLEDVDDGARRRSRARSRSPTGKRPPRARARYPSGSLPTTVSDGPTGLKHTPGWRLMPREGPILPAVTGPRAQPRRPPAPA